MGYIIPDRHSREMHFVDGRVSIPVGNLLEIESISTMSHGENKTYQLTMREERPDGHTRRFDLDIADVAVSNEQTMRSLIVSGYVIKQFRYSQHYRDYILTTARHMINEGALNYYHTALGFTTVVDGSKQFLLGDATFNGIKSNHKQEIPFKSGTMEKYLEFLKKDILSKKETRLALTFGLSSILASELEEYADINTVLLNFSGPSSTGKTTIAQFIASLWGSPKISNLGIVRTFNSTNNAKIESIAGVNGVSIVFDDASSVGNHDFSSFIYNLAAGENKLRMDQNLNLRDTKGRWSGVIVITSESNILEQSTKTGGSIPRLLDLSNIAWTRDAKHSKDIKHAIKKDHGHLGLDFYRHYCNKSLLELQTIYDNCESELDSLIASRDAYSNRIISKLAVFYATAKMIEEFYSFEGFSAFEIRDFLVSLEQKTAGERSVETKALELIKEYIITEQNHLAAKHSNGKHIEIARGRYIGYREFFKDRIAVTVMSSEIKLMLEKNGIYQWTQVLTYLETLPFVKKYGKSNRVSEKNNILGVRTITFHFSYPEEVMFRSYRPDQHNMGSLSNYKPIDEVAMIEVIEDQQKIDVNETAPELMTYDVQSEFDLGDFYNLNE
jgi:hypothetical protein